MDNTKNSSEFIVPTHLAETLRYKMYIQNKNSDILRLASQLALNKSDDVSFLGYPVEWKVEPWQTDIRDGSDKNRLKRIFVDTTKCIELV